MLRLIDIFRKEKIKEHQSIGVELVTPGIGV